MSEPLAAPADRVTPTHVRHPLDAHDEYEAVWIIGALSITARRHEVVITVLDPNGLTFTSAKATTQAAIFGQAALASAGCPVLWTEYRAMSTGPYSIPDPGSAIWNQTPCRAVGFDRIDSTFDRTYLSDWIRRRHESGWHTVAVESRTWRGLCGPGPWTHSAELSTVPSTGSRCRR